MMEFNLVDIPGWLVVGAALLAAFVLGLLLGRFFSPGHRQLRHLRVELARTSAELADYQRRVTDHFASTARMFNSLTDEYQAVYRHLASGCHDLCREQHPRLEDEVSLQRMKMGEGRVEGEAGTAQPEAPEAPPVPASVSRGRIVASEGLGIG